MFRASTIWRRVNTFFVLYTESLVAGPSGSQYMWGKFWGHSNGVEIILPVTLLYKAVVVPADRLICYYYYPL